MGYGTVLSPILIIMGYDPLKVVPAILISQFFTDIAACFCHHSCGNVNLKFNSKDFKAAILLGIISVIGVVISILIAIKIPKQLLTFYIGSLVAFVGIFILFTRKKIIQLSFRKLCAVSLLAAFNKGISGGGYGPLVMGGQLISGINAKNSVGITAFAEALTCLAGFIFYLISAKHIDWGLVFMLTAFAILAVPLASYTVKRFPAEKIKFYVGIFITVLGFLTIFRVCSG